MTCHCGNPANDRGNGVEDICDSCLAAWTAAGEPELCPCSSSETVLYAVRIGAEDWEEEIITTNPTAIEAATEWAKANGFDRFRIATFTAGAKPDFTKAINA